MTLVLAAALLSGAPDPAAAAFLRAAAPILAKRCVACHGSKKAEADVDFEAVRDAAAVRARIVAWQRAAELVETGQMPPKGAAPLAAADRAALLAALKALLRDEAAKHAGDPGPAVLRRLTNAEFGWTVRDLSGVDSLDPARNFPADGAAGEGFANVGAALALSPTLLTRYLDAGKEIAEHAVLLSDGFRFGPGTSRRDATDELLAKIKAVYARDADRDGKLPLAPYLRALAEGRTDSALNHRYLSRLRAALAGGAPSPLLDPFRERFRNLRPADVPGLVADIAAWQQALQRFQTVGHVKPWIVDVDPIAAAQAIRFAVPGDGAVALAARGAGRARWRNPRLLVPGRAEPVALADAANAARGFSAWRSALLAAAAPCLELAADAATNPALEVAAAAARRGVPRPLADAWLQCLGVAPGQPARLGTPFGEPLRRVGGFDFVAGWGKPETPSVVANSADREVRIPGTLRGRSVAVHPAPTLAAAVAWRSPIAGTVRVEASALHVHPECGNGVEWTLEIRRGQRRQRLAGGIAHGGQVGKAGPFAGIAVRPGDAVALLVGPRDGNHACDLTAVELTVMAEGREAPTWSLAEDVAPNILAGNPHADRRGRAGVWTFFAEPVDAAADRGDVPAGSLLARWQNAPGDAARRELGRALANLLARPPADANHPDARAAKLLGAAGGPLLAGIDWRTAPPGSPAAVSTGTPIMAGAAWSGSDLEMPAPGSTRWALAAEWFAGATFAAEAEAAGDGLVQAAATAGAVPPVGRALRPDLPILAATPAARSALAAACQEFRALFPLALCYARIVPVDEAVTLELFHRDDEPLRRLMLDDGERSRLDALWAELRWASQEAFASSRAYAQLMEFATQDSNPALFEHLRKPLAAAAAKLQQDLQDAEPRQLDALAAFAAKAWRRPLAAAEANGLRALHGRLRAEGLTHEEAFRLALARILSAPAFVYRLERPPAGAAAGPVSDWELAARLSYFLWSSLPDDELRRAAAAGRLRDPDVLATQARRMLRDPKSRRLAEEFACGWLQLADFLRTNEKSERHFPEFAGLRAAMREEVVLLFADSFQNDGPALGFLDADHAFVNEALARHYGIGGVAGAGYRRVEGLRALGRGGILAQAASLSKQSGASRTSPVLRGAWVAETLLGEKLPKPPKNVPPLPEDEAAADLTVRQLAERHAKDERCAVCHRRIDGFGFALEGFDAIGRKRDRDLGGRAVDARATAPDGTPIDGLDGLRRYLSAARRADVERQFCRKLLGFALGRGVRLSDEPLLDDMRKRLAAADGRIGAAFEAIVLSRQFREIRGRDRPADD